MQREHVDDDFERDFHAKLLKSSILKAREEISSIAQEKQILTDTDDLDEQQDIERE